MKEDVGMYPPRFNVVISCSPTAKHHMARFKFTGAEKEIVFDIPLIPLPISSKLVGIGATVLDHEYCRHNPFLYSGSPASTESPITNDPKPLGN